MAGWSWLLVFAVALFVYAFYKLTEMYFGDRRKMELIREKLERAKKAGEEERRKVLAEATTEMNKILVRRMVISLVLLIPLLWVYSLGEIETPIGRMGAIWWYVISYLVVAGGVWLGSTLQKKAKKGGR